MSEESVQKQPTAPVRTIAEIRMEETDSTSSEDEELTVQEGEQLNKTLAGLGVPIVAIDATPISMAFEPPPASENIPAEIIQIPSDTEEGEAAPLSTLEHSTLPEMMTSDTAAESPPCEIDPNSALVVHGLELLHQATEVVADQQRLEEASSVSVADANTSLPPETPFEDSNIPVERLTLEQTPLRVLPHQKLLKLWRTSKRNCHNVNPKRFQTWLTLRLKKLPLSPKQTSLKWRGRLSKQNLPQEMIRPQERFPNQLLLMR